MNCNIKRRIWSRELKETINAFLNRQRESRTETNRGDFNFLITGRGYHRYSFLHKSEHWLPLSTLSSPSPPLSVLLFLFYILFPNLSFSFFWLILSLSVVLLITEKGWRRLRLLISSPLCCVAIETRGWRCMLCFFVSREKQTASSDGRRTEEIRHKETVTHELYFTVKRSAHLCWSPLHHWQDYGQISIQNHQNVNQ